MRPRPPPSGVRTLDDTEVPWGNCTLRGGVTQRSQGGHDGECHKASGPHPGMDLKALSIYAGGACAAGGRGDV